MTLLGFSLLKSLLLLLAVSIVVGEEVSVVTYVSSNGTDEVQCLGGYCKTLGYVLGNIGTINCTNCTIVVTYSHGVFQYDNASHTANLTSIEYLHIVGINMPVLDFEDNGVLLHLNSYNTSVVIEGVEIYRCVGDDNSENNCIGNGGLGYFYKYFQQFSLLDIVVSNNSKSISVMAQNIECKNSLFHHGIIELALYVPHNFTCWIANCTFIDITFGMLGSIIDIVIDHLSESSGNILIENCTFSIIDMELEHNKINTIISADAYTISKSNITFTLQNCKFEKSTVVSHLQHRPQATSK